MLFGREHGGPFCLAGGGNVGPELVRWKASVRHGRFKSPGAVGWMKVELARVFVRFHPRKLELQATYTSALLAWKSGSWSALGGRPAAFFGLLGEVLGIFRWHASENLELFGMKRLNVIRDFLGRIKRKDREEREGEVMSFRTLEIEERRTRKQIAMGTEWGELMSATILRDRIQTLVKSDPAKGLEVARAIREPWFRAQALAWAARFSDDDPCAVAREAAKAAKDCDDDYKRAAVRAWEIAALGERGFKREAARSLEEALAVGKEVEPASSRSEALFLLMQAAFRIDRDAAEKALEVLKAGCGYDEHWRCKRAVRDGEKMSRGELKPRVFFW